MNSEELNEFTKYKKFSSPFVKDENWKNTKELSQKLPKTDWVVTEKIDGTSIRLILTKPDDGEREVLVGSRKLILNENDKGSKPFFECLKDVNIHKLKEYFNDVDSTIVIYGEGYGAGIQKGGGYSNEKRFRVFDIRIGKAYQEFSYVQKVCMDNQLNLVPVTCVTDELNYDSCLKELKKHEKTLVDDGTITPEGLVYKSEPVLLNKYGERLIFKVKHKDFK